MALPSLIGIEQSLRRPSPTKTKMCDPWIPCQHLLGTLGKAPTLADSLTVNPVKVKVLVQPMPQATAPPGIIWRHLGKTPLLRIHLGGGEARKVSVDHLMMAVVVAMVMVVETTLLPRAMMALLTRPRHAMHADNNAESHGTLVQVLSQESNGEEAQCQPHRPSIQTRLDQ